jgi:ribonuclease Z
MATQYLLEVIGSGEAFSTLDLNTAFLLSPGRASKTGTTLLIDCGYQIPAALWKRSTQYKKIDAIYFTHTHADHCFGVVPLLMRFWEEKRKRPLALIGPTGFRKTLETLFELGYAPGFKRLKFKIEWIEVESGDFLLFGDLLLSFAKTEHKSTNLAVKVDLGSKYSIGVSGDGWITAASKKLLSSCDLVFHEAFSVSQKIPGHTNFVTLVREFKKTKSTLVITHPMDSERSKIATIAKKKKILLAHPQMQFMIDQRGVHHVR